jgi:hypothetical protein
MICPSCNREVVEGKSTCNFCGLIFAKWKGALPRPSREHVSHFATVAVQPEVHREVRPEPEPEAVTERIRTPAFIFGILAALLVVLIIALGVRTFISGVGKAVQMKGAAKSGGSADPAGARLPSTNPRSDFDQILDCSGDPLGLAWGNGAFVVGNRTSPWGFLRFKPAESGAWASESVQVIEPVYQQQVAFRAVTWNGKKYVGYTDGAYFDRSYKNVFTLHDPGSLKVDDYFPAPELIGGLAWDGSGYWAATRRNTEDSREPAFLYHLDQHFNVLGRYDPPAVGCQGLAWDGQRLWWVDVFTNRVYLLRTDGPKPEVVHSYQTDLGYLSGIAFDGSSIWVAEYGDKKLRRLNPKLHVMWANGQYRIAHYQQAATMLETSAPADITGMSVDELVREIKANPGRSRGAIEQLDKMGARDKAVAALQETLRSPDNRIHSDAKETLRQMGVAPSYDRYVNNFSRSAEEADAIEMSAELMGSSLRASWRIYFGSQIFAASSSSARYKATVKGGSLTAPVVKEFEARPGDNVRDEELASGLGPGRYTVEITISAQFQDAGGTNRTLLRTVPPLEVGR